MDKENIFKTVVSTMSLAQEGVKTGKRKREIVLAFMKKHIGEADWAEYEPFVSEVIDMVCAFSNLKKVKSLCVNPPCCAS